ncbi:MAG TPA: PAS domain S-box protein, partial [Nitrospiria bacterium]
LGYSRKELLGKKVFDISKGIPDFKAWSALVKRLKEQRSMSLEGVHQRKNGSTFPIEASVSYISIGGGDFLVSVVRDITARREAETVFNRLSRQNELILANSEEGIFGFDLNGRTTFINPAGARMFGWEPEELIGKHQHSVLHHSRADGTTHPVEECPIYAALEDGEVHQARDEVFWRKDGSWFPVEYTSSPIREDGRVTGAVVIFRDDTERKAEEVARFKTILEAAPDAVVGVDQEGVIRLVNTQTERLFGYARSALLGQKVEILLPDRFRESHSQHREKFFKDPKTRAMIGRELAGLRKDGTEFPVDVSLSLVNTDQGELSVSMIRDVTENRKLNEAIRNTVSELQLTVDSIDALVLVVDLEGRVVRCNSRVESFCGLEGTEIIGRLCGDLGNEKPFSAMAELSELVGNSGKPKTIQVREETGSGIWEISANFSGETWSGKPWVIIVARDVTDQVRLQELVHQNKRLTVLGELVSGVSHEVRNPLFSISATLDAFEARFGKREEYARYLEVFRSANQRLLRLMRDLLDLGRPSRLERVPSSFPMVIGKAIEACEPVAASRKVTIVKRGKPEKTSPFLMDPARISQVFQNLIENAVQYSPEGEKVVLEWDEVERDGEAWLECAVLDSGNGFSKDDLKRVFEPFYSRRPGGTGLGMAIVQRIVEEHGGSVAVENQPKSGGCIRVRIP